MQPLLQKLRVSVVLCAFLTLPSAFLVAAEKSEPPVPVRMVAPEAPPNFARNGVTGLVTITFVVDDKGNVQEASVVKTSHPELSEPALKAIKKWRFKPGTKDGAPVAVHVTVPIKFEVES